MNKIAVLS